MPAVARALVLGLAALAVVVQLGVWGATKIRTDGALLESWLPWFGWPYGLLLALVLLGLCVWLRIDRGPLWLARTWALVGGGLVALRLAGRPVGLDEAAAHDGWAVKGSNLRPWD
jgi:hypothetical protein